MWNRILTGALAFGCMALAVALAFGGRSARVVIAARPAMAAGTEPALPPAQSLAEQMLERRIASLDIKSSDTLGNAIRTLADATNSNIYVNWKTLRDIDRDTYLGSDIRMTNVTLGRALHRILDAAKPGGIGFRADVDSIVVTSAEHLAKSLPVVIYNVRDLLVAMRPTTPDHTGPSFQECVDVLMTIITNLVDPQSWIEGGGTASIREMMGLLVVSQTPENHEALASLLSAIRDCSRMTAPASVRVEPDFSTAR